MSQLRRSKRLALGSLTIVAASATAQDATVLRTEQELTISIETPAIAESQCEATASSSYHQRGTAARLESTIQVAGCDAAASGKFTVSVRVRGDDGVVQALEFAETWQRSAAGEVVFTNDYPIGDNVELVGVRLRGITCTCAEAPAGAAPPAPAQD